MWKYYGKQNTQLNAQKYKQIQTIQDKMTSNNNINPVQKNQLNINTEGLRASPVSGSDISGTSDDSAKRNNNNKLNKRNSSDDINNDSKRNKTNNGTSG